MKLLLRSLVVIFCMLIAPNTKAMELRTDSFKLLFPDNWNIKYGSGQTTIEGPNNEIVIVSSVRISGHGNVKDLKKVRIELMENLKKSMEGAAQDHSLLSDGTAKVENMEHDNLWLELRCKTRDGRIFFDQYGMLGPRTAVYVTVEGDISAAESGEVARKVVRNIEWY